MLLTPENQTIHLSKIKQTSTSIFVNYLFPCHLGSYVVVSVLHNLTLELEDPRNLAKTPALDYVAHLQLVLHSYRK